MKVCNNVAAVGRYELLQKSFQNSFLFMKFASYLVIILK